ncbi:CRISPR-associated endonuclease Cas2 [Methanospirillum sp.]
MMLAWILYDITEDKIRNKIAGLCKDYGFIRYQKSVFCGETQDRILKILVSKISDVMSTAEENEDSVLIFTVCDTCLKNRLEVGKKLNPDSFKIPRLIIIG